MSTLASTGVIRNQYELAYNCVALLHMFHRGNDRLAKRNSPHWRLWQPNKAHMNIPWPLNGDINLQYNANNVLREKISDKLLLGCWFVQIHERVWTCVIYGPWPLHLNWILSASLLVRSQTATKSSHYAKGCCYETPRSLGIEVSLLFTPDKSSSRARCQQRLVIVQLDLVQIGSSTTNNLITLDVPVECRTEGKSVVWIGAEGGDWMRQATFGV